MRSKILFNNVSLAGDLTSEPFKYNDMERLSIHSIFSGAPDGSLSIQVSNDMVEHGTDVANWIDYPDSIVNILGVPQVMYNIRDLAFRWLRVIYIRSGGSGNITTTFSTVKRF